MAWELGAELGLGVCGAADSRARRARGRGGVNSWDTGGRDGLGGGRASGHARCADPFFYTLAARNCGRAVEARIAASGDSAAITLYWSEG
eukprot:368061-Prymnesium_polylepis.1